MPYDKLADLPEEVKKLPEQAQHIWMAAFNNAFHQYNGDESTTFAVAWSAVKNKYIKDTADNWHLKASQSMDLLCAVGTTEDNKGYAWNVRVVKFGKDKNGIYWDKDVLLASTKKLEGAKVFMLDEAQHQAERHPYGKPTTQIVGWLAGVKNDKEGILAILHIVHSQNGKLLRDNLLSSKEKNFELLGLSVDVVAVTDTKNVNGEQLTYASDIKDITVDVVYDPAAGGQFVSLAAATKIKGDLKMLKDLVEKMKGLYPQLYAANKDTLDKEDLSMETFMRIMASVEQVKLPEVKKVEVPPAPPYAKEPIAEMKQLLCSIKLDKYLGEAKLPEGVEQLVRKQYEDKIFEEVDLKASIKAYKETFDKFQGDVLKAASRIEFKTDDMDSRIKELDDVFEGKAKSFRAAYASITGDTEVTGQTKNMKRLTASLISSTFALVLQDSMRKKMLSDYKNAAYNADWRKICTVVPLNDFRTNHRTRFGGYGNIPIVEEKAPYTSLSSPTDEEATYAVAKRGGTEDVTWEMVKNDDVGVIKKIPKRMAAAAARTLYEFVFDFLRTNPTIYDSVALFHSNHLNIGSTAFDSAYLQAARLRMMIQAELSSAKRLGLTPKYVIHPINMTKAVYDIITAPRNSDFDPTTADFVRTLQLEQIEVPYWTDTNNWYLAANPDFIDGLEIGFLDGNENPDIIVQNDPQVGTNFTHDVITYKLVHVYGGAITDFRAFDGSIVT